VGNKFSGGLGGPSKGAQLMEHENPLPVLKSPLLKRAIRMEVLDVRLAGPFVPQNL